MSKKGFRPTMDEKIKREIMSTLSEDEIQRIKEIRDASEVKPGSFSFELLVKTDSLRRRLKELDNVIYKRMWNIENLHNEMHRCDDQIQSNEIYDELKPGVKMNKYELSTLKKHQQWLALGEVRAITLLLVDLRALVNHKDIVGGVILTLEEWQKYVDKIKIQLAEFGYDLYD